MVFSLYNYMSLAYVLFLLNYVFAVPSITGTNKFGDKQVWGQTRLTLDKDTALQG